MTVWQANRSFDLRKLRPVLCQAEEGPKRLKVEKRPQLFRSSFFYSTLYIILYIYIYTFSYFFRLFIIFVFIVFGPQTDLDLLSTGFPPFLYGSTRDLSEEQKAGRLSC